MCKIVNEILGDLIFHRGLVRINNNFELAVEINRGECI